MKQKYKEMYMDFAIRAAECSVANRLKVGCCIVTPNGASVVGLNGTPPGWPTNVCELEDGTTCSSVRHAEQAALAKLHDEGISAKGSTVFITHSPCIYCAKLLHSAGIDQVYFLEYYRSDEGLIYLDTAGIPFEKFVYGNSYEQ